MEFVKLQMFGFIGLGNVGGKQAGSWVRSSIEGYWVVSRHCYGT